MADFLNAVIIAGPNKGLTIGESMWIGRAISEGSDTPIDRAFLLKKRIKNKNEAVALIQAEIAETQLEVAALEAK
jgi:hypothetical protein